MQLNSVLLRTMTVEYEGTRQKLLENLEHMTSASVAMPVFTQLADEHNRFLAELVEIFFDFESTPGLPPTFDGEAIYRKFVEAMKRLSVMMKPKNLAALIDNLKSIRHIYAFALHLEQSTSTLYTEMAGAAENGNMRDRLERLAALSRETSRSLETKATKASPDQITIQITPLKPESGEDTAYEDIIV